MHRSLTESYPPTLPNAAERDRQFAAFGFSQGRMLNLLRRRRTRWNPHGIETPKLLAARLAEVNATAITAEWWLGVEKDQVLEGKISLEQWGEIADALGEHVVDILRWLQIVDHFGSRDTIGACIRFEREQLGLTQAQLAARVGGEFTQSHVWRLENVKRTSLENLQRVAAGLDVHFTRLLPAGNRDMVVSLLNQSKRSTEDRVSNNFFQRRKRCQKDNPELGWHEMTPDLLDTLGY